MRRFPILPARRAPALTLPALLLGALLSGGVVAQEDPPVPVPQGTVPSPFLPFDRARFEAAARQLGATDAHLQAFAQAIGEVGLSRAADDLLRAAQPSYDAAVKRYENGDQGAALELTKVLAATKDSLLQAHVRHTLARVFLDSDDPEAAVEVLNDYLTENVNLSPLDAETAFFYSQALAEIPLPELAIPRLRAFLQWFPDASERLRSAAHQMVRELEQQQGSQLHQLADQMKKTTRDLQKKKTGEPVQLDQEKYIEQLDQLIEMFEERESQASGGGGNSPAQSSTLRGGEGKVADLKTDRQPSADRWLPMRDAERKKIEAEVQNGLPPKFRKMLEKYYKKLGTAPGNQ